MAKVDGSQKPQRYLTGTRALDDVLDGGFYSGTLVTISGDAGVGKSTLMLQVAADMSKAEIYESATRKRLPPLNVAWVSSEETEERVWERAARIGGVGERFQVLCRDNITDIHCVIAPCRPDIVVVDSLDLMYDDRKANAFGSVVQIEACAHHFHDFAHQYDAVVVASVRNILSVEHITDVALTLAVGKRGERVLGAWKNRFATTEYTRRLRATSGGFESVDGATP
jgi:DNA repair protein RadA/Sms